MSGTSSGEIDYVFNQPTAGGGEQQDILLVKFSTPATGSTAYGFGYPVTSIYGSIGGADITGEVGSGGLDQTDAFNPKGFDNTIFTSDSYGQNIAADNSLNGIDCSDLEFSYEAPSIMSNSTINLVAHTISAIA